MTEYEKETDAKKKQTQKYEETASIPNKPINTNSETTYSKEDNQVSYELEQSPKNVHNSFLNYEKIGIYTKRPVVDFALKQKSSDFMVEELFTEGDKNGYNQIVNYEVIKEYFNEKEIKELFEPNIEKDQRIFIKSLFIDEKEKRKTLHKELNKVPHILTKPEDGTILIFKSNEKAIFSFILRKENRDTVETVRDLSKELNVKFDNIKFAGNKDRSAITYQRVSVEGIYLDQVRNFPHIKREREHLRLGKFFGNKFTIILRRIPGTNISLDQAIQNIEMKKIPNFFGPQRFGRHFDNHLVGELIYNKNYEEAVNLILKIKKTDTDYVGQAKSLFHSGKYKEAYAAFPKNCMVEKSIAKAIKKGPRHAIFSMKKTLRIFYKHAYQSFKFNQELSQLISKSDEQPFLFLLGSKSRRNTFVEPQDLLIVPHSHGYQITFILPPSAYATIVIRELIGDTPLA